LNRLILSLDFGPIVAAILDDRLMQGVIGYREDLRSEICSVLRSCLTHGYCGHWDSTWHLHGGKQGVETLERTAIDGHANDWALGVRGDGTCQVSGHASSTDKYPTATVFRVLHVGLSARGCSVSTCHLHFITYTQCF
jgi:hypothetical protein